jgi:hypothetical protein
MSTITRDCSICDALGVVTRSITGRFLCAECQSATSQNTGLEFKRLALDLAIASERVLSSVDRSEGRVRCHVFPTSPHDN